MKLLAVDFDYTLLNNNDFDKNIKYVNKFAEMGNIFVIITGRHIKSLLKSIDNKIINYSYLICNDGGIIFDKQLNVIYRKDIPKELVAPITTSYEKACYIDNWYINTGLSLVKDKNSPANDLIGHFTDRRQAQILLDNLKKQYPDIHGYLSQNWINITERSVNKGSGIIELLKIININITNVYTIGDNVNDIPMANYNFNNYCMTNSVEELKRKGLKQYNAVYKLVEDILKDELK